MSTTDLVNAAIIRELHESQTIFGIRDDLFEALAQGATTKKQDAFENLRVLAILNGFFLEEKNQLNAASLRRFLEWGDPAMTLLAAEIMHDCGIHAKIEVGDLEFATEDPVYRSERIYAFGERKLFVKAVHDKDFGFVARWHQEAYWQNWHGGFDIVLNPRPGVIASLEMRDSGPGLAWNTVVGYESYTHWPRIEKSLTLKEVLRTFDVHDPPSSPPLELPDRPPGI